MGYKCAKKIMKKYLFSIIAVFVLCSWTSAWVCSLCDGTGHSKTLTCRRCTGKGTIPTRVKCDIYGCENGKMYDKYGKRINCYGCGGSGFKYIDITCDDCGGWGSPYCVKCHGTGEVEKN